MKYLLVVGDLTEVFGEEYNTENARDPKEKKRISGRKKIKERNIPVSLVGANQLLDINTHLLRIIDEKEAVKYGDVLTEEEAILKYAELQEGKETPRELV